MTMDLTLFDVVATELKDENSAAIDMMAEQAEFQLNESMWGDKYAMALVLLTAHIMTMNARRGTGGDITSEKVGDLARSYGAQNKHYMESTSYGQEFLRLRKTLLISPLIV